MRRELIGKCTARKEIEIDRENDGGKRERKRRMEGRKKGRKEGRKKECGP